MYVLFSCKAGISLRDRRWAEAVFLTTDQGDHDGLRSIQVLSGANVYDLAARGEIVLCRVGIWRCLARDNI